MKNRLAVVLALSCLLFPGLLAAGTEAVEPALAPAAPAAGPGCSAPGEESQPQDAIAALFQAPLAASCTCMQARYDCDHGCWLGGCVVGTFSCSRYDPCNYVCECQC